MNNVPCTFIDNISFNPPNNLLRQMWFLSILQMRKLRLRKIQSLCPKPLSSDPQTIWFQSLCFFFYYISLFSKENKCYSDTSRPASIHLLFRLMEASPGTSIQGNGSTQGSPDFQTASCAQGLILFWMPLSLDILILCDPDPLYPSNQRH